MVEEMLVDRKVLDSLKRRMLKEYPKEHAEYIVGHTKHAIGGDDQAHVFYFRPPNSITRHKDSVEYVDDNEECGDNEDAPMRPLGLIHSHPDASADLSDIDQELFNEALDDEIWGVCGIRVTPKRRFVTFAFFNREGRQLRLTIAE